MYTNLQQSALLCILGAALELTVDLVPECCILRRVAPRFMDVLRHTNMTTC